MFADSSPRWLHHFASTPAKNASSCYSTSPLTFGFFILAILIGLQQYLIVVLTCISLMTYDVEHFFNMFICHLYKPRKCTTPRVNSNVNQELWVIMKCQCSFTNYNTRTTLTGVYCNWRGQICVRTEGLWEPVIPSSQFCYKPKTALKK